MREKDPAQRRHRGPRLGALALFARMRREQQIALRLAVARARRRRAQAAIVRRALGGAASPSHGGGEAAGAAQPVPHGRLIPLRLVAAERSRRFRLIAGRGASGAGCDGLAARRSLRQRARAAARYSAAPGHRPEAKHDQPGAGRNLPGQDHRIAETEFLDRDAEPDREQDPPKTGQSQRPTTRPSSNPPPGCGQMPAAADATIPSYCAERQPPIVGNAVQNYRGYGNLASSSRRQVTPGMRAPYEDLLRCQLSIAALHQEITPQFPITWKGNCAIWMPGNEARSARKCWAIGTPGYQ